MELILIRHAQTHSNLIRALDTAAPGADLTNLGQMQARELGDELAGERINAVHTSPLLRARRTAGLLAQPHGLEPVLEDGLVEVSAGDWEMATEEPFVEAYNGVVIDWVRGDLNACVPGGENGHEVMARVDEVVERILSKGYERVAIIAHGAVLRGWSGVRVAGARGLAVTHPLRNAGFVRLVSQTGGLQDLVVLQWGEQSMLLGENYVTFAD